MAKDGLVRQMTLAIALLVPIAALVTVAVSLIQVLVVFAQHDFAGAGFAVDWGATAQEFLVVFAVLVAVLLIGRTGQLSLGLALLIPVASLMTVVVAWSDTNLAMNRRELAAVGFGFPYDWLIQDHSWMSPPLPYQLSTYDIRESPTTVAWGAFALDFLLVYAVLAGALLIMMFLLWRQRERAGNREWESQRPEAERFGRKVDGQVGRLLSSEGWHLNLGACSAGPGGFAVLYEKDFMDHEIWFTFDPLAGIAEARIPNWWSEPFPTRLEDGALAHFVREVEAAIDASDGLRHLDEDV